MSTARIVIVLDLDEVEDCPHGTATGVDGATRPFHGWLALASVIEALAHPNPGATAPLTDGGDQR
jgi:hypothetical protein